MFELKGKYQHKVGENMEKSFLRMLRTQHLRMLLLKKKNEIILKAQRRNGKKVYFRIYKVKNFKEMILKKILWAKLVN